MQPFRISQRYLRKSKRLWSVTEHPFYYNSPSFCEASNKNKFDDTLRRVKRNEKNPRYVYTIYLIQLKKKTIYKTSKIKIKSNTVSKNYRARY